jgi:HEAT repeat protein
VPILLETAKDPQPQVRLQTLLALEAIDLKDAAVIRALVAALDDSQDEIRQMVRRALIRASKSAVEQLTALLKAPEASRRGTAADLLKQIGPPAREALPVLLQSLQDTDAAVRLRALQAVRDIDPAAPSVLAAFLLSFLDADAEVRIAAQQALVKVGKVAVPTLTAALKHPQVVIRRGAVETLKQIGVEGQLQAEIRLAVPSLIQGLQDRDPEVREGAAWALGEVDDQLRTAVPALRQALQSKPKTGQPLPAQTNVKSVPLPRLLDAIAAESGARLLPLLDELSRRRGDVVLVRLAIATARDDAKVQAHACQLLIQYLATKPTETQEKQAAAKLRVCQSLFEDRRESLAFRRCHELIDDFPGTGAAEETRHLLASKRQQ